MAPPLSEISHTHKDGKYIFHPKSFNGHANSEKKTIKWGHSEDWKNYSTVYLAHEILHIIVNDTSENMHAIIQLATDNELRIRLNKEGEYFTFRKIPDIKEMSSYIRKIFDLEKEIYPKWKEFLKDNKNRSIIDLEKGL